MGVLTLVSAVKQTNTLTVDLDNSPIIHWAAWTGYSSAPNFRKSGTTADDISNLSVIQGGNSDQGATSNRTIVSTNPSVNTSSYFFTFEGQATTGHGRSFTVKGDPTKTRKVRIYIGHGSSGLQFDASLSDGSAAPIVAYQFEPAWFYTAENLYVEIDFKPDSANQTLNFSFIQYFNRDYGSVGIQAVTVEEVPDPTPTVASVSNASVTEGGNLVHTVTLSAATTASANYAFSLVGNTATATTDFSTTPTFSNGVTLSGGNVTVPSGVSSFTVTYATVGDTDVESDETTTLTVGGVSGTGTIVNDDVIAGDPFDPDTFDDIFDGGTVGTPSAITYPQFLLMMMD